MHNAVMPAITIRNVPDETRNELAARAAKRGQSLQEYLLASLNDMASRPDPEEVIRRVRQQAKLADVSLSADEIVALVREDRDR